MRRAILAATGLAFCLSACRGDDESNQFADGDELYEQLVTDREELRAICMMSDGMPQYGLSLALEENKEYVARETGEWQTTEVGPATDEQAESFGFGGLGELMREPLAAFVQTDNADYWSSWEQCEAEIEAAFDGELENTLNEWTAIRDRVDDEMWKVLAGDTDQILAPTADCFEQLTGLQVDDDTYVDGTLVTLYDSEPTVVEGITVQPEPQIGYELGPIERTASAAFAECAQDHDLADTLSQASRGAREALPKEIYDDTDGIESKLRGLAGTMNDRLAEERGSNE